MSKLSWLGVLVGAAALVGAAPAASSMAQVYKARFAGHFWNGVSRSASATFSISPQGSGSALVTSNEAGHVVSGEVDVKDGMLAPYPKVWEIEAYNDLVRLIEPAKQNNMGDSWTATVPVQTGSAHEHTDVPVKVTVVGRAGSVTTYQAVGTESKTLILHGYATPVVLTVRAAVKCDGDIIAAGKIDVNDDVKAEIGEQGLAWGWSLTP